MAVEKVTQLPNVLSAMPSDIIYAVQGGISVQETLAQVTSLSVSTVILHYAGNPNGNLAGSVYQLCWDTVDNFLFVCTTTGSSSTAVWTQVVSGASGIPWTVVAGSSVTLAPNNGYIPNNSGLVTLTLPTVAATGTIIYIAGKGSGGWSIAQNASQYINIGSSQSTSGIGGSVSSTNLYDSLTLVCTTANLVWSCLGGPQGILTIV